MSKKNILVCVTGSTPQIVTETIYALLHEKEPFIPDEIHIITTGFGKDKLVKNLLETDNGVKGQYYQLAEEYSLPLEKIHFDRDTIHVVEDGKGNALSDIRSVDDNDRLADKIVDLVRGFTEEDGKGAAKNRVYASLAGGRKTMGFFLGHAMTLFAHEDDCLSHIIVTKEFENQHDFFFPPKTSRDLEVKDRDGKVTGKLNTDDAKISFAKIPFVRLRDGLDKVLLEGKKSYSETVAMAQQDMGVPEVILNYSKNMIVCGDQEIKLPPSEFSLYAVFARRKIEELVGFTRNEWTDKKAIDLWVIENNKVKDNDEKAVYPETLDDFEAMKTSFDQVKSRLHKKLKSVLGGRKSRVYEIKHVGKKSRSNVFGLGLSADQVYFEE